MIFTQQFSRWYNYVAIVGIAYMQMVSPSLADMYRCVDEKGSSTITDTPCIGTQIFSESSSEKDEPSAELIEDCVDRYRAITLDPSSIVVEQSNRRNGVLTINIRAKNVYGGIVLSVMQCPLSGNVINEARMKEYLAAAKVGIRR